MRNFVQQTFASVLGTLLGLILFLGIGTGTIILWLIAILARNPATSVQDKSMLVFDLSADITDTKASSDTGTAIQSAFSGQKDDSISLRTVLNTLAKAQQDQRIVGIYLDGTRGSSTTGLATMEEVRAALERFRAAGKTIVAYDQDWGQRDYYLGSVANQILINPIGNLELKGLSTQPLFFAGALQKYGIGVQIVRVGKFKGAVEPFILSNLSPDNRLQTQQLLNDVWGEWRSTVSKSRGVSSQQLQGIADSQGILTADEAKTRGLVNQEEYFDQVLGQLKQLTNSNQEDKTFKQISLANYAEAINANDGPGRSSSNKIAVVYAQGDIVDGQGGLSNIGGDRFARELRRLRQDDSVKAVVLRVNSPGGSATAAEVIQRELQLIRRTKPVIVSMGDVAASGGYWISAGADQIFAEPNTITGSIGVFGLLFNFQKLANEHGITWDDVKTARYGDMQTISRPKTGQELAIYQKSVDHIYDLFLNLVAAGRKLPKARVAEIAQGRVWSGKEAKQLGLVDQIGGLDAAIQYAAKQVNLGDNWELQEYPTAKSFAASLVKRLTDQSSLGQPPALLQTEFSKLKQELAILETMNDPQSIYARLPFNLKIE